MYINCLKIYLLPQKTYINRAAIKISKNLTKREIQTRTKKPTFKKDILKNFAC